MPIKTYRACLLCTLATAFLPGPARSATVPGMAGRGKSNILEPCFTSANAEMKNACGGTNARTLVIPAQTVVGGVIQAVSVVASGDGAFSSATCVALGIETDNTIVSMSNRVSSGPSITPQLVDLGTVATTTGGTIQFECSIQPGARVINADFH